MWYFKSFTKIAAILFLSGAVIHFSRIAGIITPPAVPIWISWHIMILSLYCGPGFTIFRSRISFRNALERTVTIVIAVILIASIILHFYRIITGSTEVFRFFPMWYSYASVVIMTGFSVVCYRLKLKPVPGE